MIDTHGFSKLSVVYLSDSNSPCWSIWTTCLLRRLLRMSGVGFHNVSCWPKRFSWMNTSLSWIPQKVATRSVPLNKWQRGMLTDELKRETEVAAWGIKALTQCPSTVASSSSPTEIFPLIWFTEQEPPRKGCSEAKCHTFTKTAVISKCTFINCWLVSFNFKNIPWVWTPALWNIWFSHTQW